MKARRSVSSFQSEFVGVFAELLKAIGRGFTRGLVAEEKQAPVRRAPVKPRVPTIQMLPPRRQRQRAVDLPPEPARIAAPAPPRIRRAGQFVGVAATPASDVPADAQS